MPRGEESEGWDFVEQSSGDHAGVQVQHTSVAELVAEVRWLISPLMRRR